MLAVSGEHEAGLACEARRLRACAPRHVTVLVVKKSLQVKSVPLVLIVVLPSILFSKAWLRRAYITRPKDEATMTAPRSIVELDETGGAFEVATREGAGVEVEQEEERRGRAERGGEAARGGGWR